MKLARAALTLSMLAASTVAFADPGDAAEATPTSTADATEPGDESSEASTADATPTAQDTGNAAPTAPDAQPDPAEPPPTSVTIGGGTPSSVVVAPDPGPATAPPSDRNYVAVVVGISAYANLPDAVELDRGRSDAADVADALRSDAGFDEVFLLGDGEATRDRITELLRNQVAQLVGPDDVLLFYYVGHGIGADLGLPVLLAHDSTLENGQEDGFELTKLARDLQTWTRSGTTLVVTDVVHRNQLDGIYFYGPAADAWPQTPVNWMILSATQAESPGKDGAFGSVFAEAISGAADANRDRLVTASELFAYLVSRLSPSGQIPLATGDYDGGMVVAQDVSGTPEPEPEPEPDPDVDTAPPPEPEVREVTVYPDYSIRAAKFVWDGGAGQSVQCREEPVEACAPSCYVRDFKAGPCALKAIFDGVEMSGEVVVLGPGLYNCKRRGGALECSGP